VGELKKNASEMNRITIHPLRNLSDILKAGIESIDRKAKKLGVTSNIEFVSIMVFLPC